MLRSRRRKLDYFIRVFQANDSCTVLDVGAADVEHSPYDNYLEKHYPYPHQITALSIYPLDHFRERYPGIRAVTYAGARMPFHDQAFDIVYCNAVIEHVGALDEQVRFLKEVARVGKRFFLTTPSKAFLVEVHTNLPFVHWLPRNARDRIFAMLGKGWAAGDYMHLLSYCSLRAVILAAGLKDCRIVTKRFAGFPLTYFVIGGST